MQADQEFSKGLFQLGEGHVIGIQTEVFAHEHCEYASVVCEEPLDALNDVVNTQI